MDYVSQLKDQFAKDISQSYTGDLGLLALANEEFCFDKDHLWGFFFQISVSVWFWLYGISINVENIVSFLLKIHDWIVTEIL